MQFNETLQYTVNEYCCANNLIHIFSSKWSWSKIVVQFKVVENILSVQLAVLCLCGVCHFMYSTYSVPWLEYLSIWALSVNKTGGGDSCGVFTRWLWRKDSCPEVILQGGTDGCCAQRAQTWTHPAQLPHKRTRVASSPDFCLFKKQQEQWTWWCHLQLVWFLTTLLNGSCLEEKFFF